MREIIQLVQDGVITDETSVWADGLSDWMPFKDIKHACEWPEDANAHVATSGLQPEPAPELDHMESDTRQDQVEQLELKTEEMIKRARQENAATIQQGVTVMTQALESKLAADQAARKQAAVEQTMRRVLGRMKLNMGLAAFNAWVNYVAEARRMQNLRDKTAYRWETRIAGAAFTPWLLAARDFRARQVREAVQRLETRNADLGRLLGATQDEMVEQRGVLSAQQEEMQELIEDAVLSRLEDLRESFGGEVSAKTEAVREALQTQISDKANSTASSRLQHATGRAVERVGEIRVSCAFTSWLASARSLQNRRTAEQIEALEDVVEGHKAEAAANFGALSSHVEDSLSALHGEQLASQSLADAAISPAQVGSELPDELASALSENSAKTTELGESVMELQDQLGEALALATDRESSAKAQEESLLLVQHQLGEALELLQDHSQQADAHTAELAAMKEAAESLQGQSRAATSEVKQAVT
jgi:hypothetical protein